MNARDLVFVILLVMVGISTGENGGVFKPTKPTEAPVSAVFEFMVHTLKYIGDELLSFPASEKIKFRDSVKESLTGVIDKLEQIEETVRQQESTLDVQTQLITKLDRRLGEIKDILNTQGSTLQMPNSGVTDPCENGAVIYSKVDIDVESLRLVKLLNIPHDYRISDSDEHGNFVIHGYWHSAIGVVDFISDQNTYISEYTAPFQIHKMVTTAPNQYAAIDYNNNLFGKLHILDAGFHIVHTYSSEPTIAIKDILYLSKNKFIMLESTRSKPYKVTIKTVRIEQQEFVTLCAMDVQFSDDVKSLRHIEVNKEKNIVHIVSVNHVYMVNLDSQYYTTHDITQYLSVFAHSVYNLGDFFLIGDDYGNILKFDDEWRFKTNLDNLKLGSEDLVRSITKRNGRLYVTSDANQLYIYE